jgi:hypothetical protein
VQQPSFKNRQGKQPKNQCKGKGKAIESIALKACGKTKEAKLSGSLLFFCPQI